MIRKSGPTGVVLVVQLAADIIQQRRESVPSELSLPTTILESDGQLSENLHVRMWDMLARYVNQTGYTPPVDRQTVILDLACGTCPEAFILNKFFGMGNQIRLIGIDNNRLVIERAIHDNNVNDNSYPQSEFYARDATNLAAIPQVPDKADVVMIRNQNIGVNEAVWTEIFKQGLARLDDGIMIVTSLVDVEHPKAVEVLTKLDCEIMVNEPNQFAKPHNEYGDAFDRNIVIVKKKKPVD